jgi:predicted nuclease with RNAse H fold
VDPSIVPRRRLTVIGIDLGGVERRPTGICLLRGWTASTILLFGDDEILDFVRRARPSIVAVDAPLNLPPGRKSMADRNGNHYRPCDLELRRRKIPFFPITLGPMRQLTERGILLKRRLEEEGFRPIEIYPGGAQDLWGLPRARRNLPGLRGGLRRLGIRGLGRGASDHELDAATGALVGRLFLLGKAEILGDSKTGAIVMPGFSIRRRAAKIKAVRGEAR